MNAEHISFIFDTLACPHVRNRLSCTETERRNDEYRVDSEILLPFHEAWEEEVGVPRTFLQASQLASQLQAQVNLLQQKYQKSNYIEQETTKDPATLKRKKQAAKCVVFSSPLLEKSKARFLSYETRFSQPQPRQGDRDLKSDYEEMRRVVCDDTQCLDLLREVYFRALQRKRDAEDAAFDLSKLPTEDVSIKRDEQPASLSDRMHNLTRMIRSTRVPRLLSVIDVHPYASRESASIRIELSEGRRADLFALPDSLTVQVPEWWEFIKTAKDHQERAVEAYNTKKKEKKEKEEREKAEKEKAEEKNQIC